MSTTTVTTSTQDTAPALTSTAAIAALDHLAALRMLGWLSSRLEFDGAVTVDDWADAYGHAADDQTVRAARAALGEAVTS